MNKLPKIAAVTVIGIVTLVLTLSGEVRGWLTFKKQSTIPPASSNSVQSSGELHIITPPEQAVLRLTAGPYTTFVKTPRVLKREFTLKNLGNGIAEDIEIVCGVYASTQERGLIGSLASNEEKTIPVYSPNFPDDVMHQHDFTCLDSPTFSYKDPSGHHHVYFDSAGQAKEVPYNL